MKENTQQRTSRIAFEDAGAHSARAHAQDFFNGLATYEITPSKLNGFFVFEKTPHGQTCGSVDTEEQAQAMIQSWKNQTVKGGYSK
jgi:hypothetical protein